MPMMMTVVMMTVVMTMVAEAAPAVAVVPVVEAQEEGVVAEVPGAEVEAPAVAAAPQEGSRAEVMEKVGMACLHLLPELLTIENLNPVRYCSLILKKTP